MAVKTTGAEFKRFYADPAFWPDGVWHEDDAVTANGKACEEYRAVADDAQVTIDGGVVFDDSGTDINSMEGYFKKWRKAQAKAADTVTLTVVVDKSKSAAVKAAIKAAGGRVVK